MRDKSTQEALSLGVAIGVVIATLNGITYGLTAEEQLEALRMACRELEASNVGKTIQAAREAIGRLAEIVVGLDGGHDIDNPKQSSCGFGQPHGFCEKCEALQDASDALKGLGCLAK